MFATPFLPPGRLERFTARENYQESSMLWPSRSFRSKEVVETRRAEPVTEIGGNGFAL
jgi:hypothetical protein